MFVTLSAFPNLFDRIRFSCLVLAYFLKLRCDRSIPCRSQCGRTFSHFHCETNAIDPTVKMIFGGFVFVL